MMKNKSTLIFSLVLTLIFGFNLPEEMPKGWFKSGSMPGSYKIGSDRSVSKNGLRSAFIESSENSIDGFATIMQICNAGDYLGTRIKMTGYIRSENVADWAGMWLRVDSRTAGESLSFDNMYDRPVKGTSDWTRCEIVLDVPAGSGTLNYGALLSGTGKIWFDNVKFEIVDTLTREVTKDFKPELLPDKPANLDFEE